MWELLNCFLFCIQTRMKRKRKCDVPKHLQRDMGEVFMTFAQGNHELAIQQCLEIIRQGWLVLYLQSLSSIPEEDDF